MQNSIFLRRKNKVIVAKGQGELPTVYLATALKNLESLGYTFSDALLAVVKTLTPEAFVSFYNQLTTDIKQNIGAYVHFYPMYPNFPSQVMKASEAELYINAVLHYLAGLMPETEIEERFPLLELDTPFFKVIDVGTETEFIEMMKQLIGANTSISEMDKEDVAWMIQHTDNYRLVLPASIPSKENIAFVVAELLKNEKVSVSEIIDYFQTATDVLRLATALSDGDISLATNTLFKKFKRSERRLLLQLLDQTGSTTEDMIRHKERWKRLGKVLHPFEYKGKYDNALESFEIILNDKPFLTFNGKVEVALGNNDTETGIALLRSRPGEFARKLDRVIRHTDNVPMVLGAFEEVAGDVATPVLLQVMAHFKNRNDLKENRVFFPKGNVAKLFMKENDLPEIPSMTTESVVKICEETLKTRFAQLAPLGKVYLDSTLSNYLVPFSQRSASKALRTIVRGSKVDLPESDTIRFFLWWKEGNDTGRVDIDLSAVMYDEDFNYKEHLSYTNLRSLKYKAAHSGDITSAPDGASEFIDIDIPSVLEYGGRYVVMSLNSYTSQAFKDLPECFAGWMGREYPSSGEVYEPSTVQDKIDLAADTQICIPVILDLQERKVIWTDLALTRYPDFENNVEANQTGMIAMGKAMTSLVKPNLHDLFRLHAEARGTIVEQLTEADTVFSEQVGVTPMDTELIMSEYLS